jgi:hypothetical protein
MRRTLTSLIAAGAIASGLAGCADSHHTSRGKYTTNAARDYEGTQLTDKDVGFKGKQVDFGHTQYVFTSPIDFDKNQVVINDVVMADENIFRYAAVRRSHIEPHISPENRTVNFTENDGGFVAFVYDPAIKGIRTTIPAVRPEYKAEKGRHVTEFTLGIFSVPMLHMSFPADKEGRAFRDIRYCEMGGNRAALIEGGELVPNYDAGAFEFRGGRVFVSTPGAHTKEKPKAAESDGILRGEPIFELPNP